MKKFSVLMMLLFACSFSFAQSADKITDMIKAGNMSAAQASYLCGTASGLLQEDASYAEAQDVFKAKGIITQKMIDSDYLTAGSFAWLCSRTWEIKGSFMKLLIDSPRYAFRQMKADGVIPQEFDYSRKLSGRDCLNIVTDCLDKYDLKERSE